MRSTWLPLRVPPLPLPLTHHLGSPSPYTANGCLCWWWWLLFIKCRRDHKIKGKFIFIALHFVLVSVFIVSLHTFGITCVYFLYFSLSLMSLCGPRTTANTYILFVLSSRKLFACMLIYLEDMRFIEAAIAWVVLFSDFWHCFSFLSLKFNLSNLKHFSKVFWQIVVSSCKLCQPLVS